MPIQVTCPGCLKRFSVSEKFAGQEGPCPKCKALITIPKPEEEVVIHAPAHSEAGAVSAGGISTLKTSRKKDAKFRPIVFAVVLGVVLIVVLLAVLLRGAVLESWLVPIIATVLLGPPCAWAGYTFLRDAELEPYRGVELWIRVTVCGLVFAMLWGVYLFIGEQLFADKVFQTTLQLQTYQMFIVVAIVLGLGTFAGYVAFDLEPISAFFNFALFFTITILLRLVVDLPALPGLPGG